MYFINLKKQEKRITINLYTISTIFLMILYNFKSLYLFMCNLNDTWHVMLVIFKKNELIVYVLVLNR